MSAHLSGSKPCSKERFRLEFQQDLKEYVARNGSVIEGFNLVWDKLSTQFSLLEREQAEIHWELVQWARSYDLFTGGDHKPLATTVDL